MRSNRHAAGDGAAADGPPTGSGRALCVRWPALAALLAFLFVVGAVLPAAAQGVRIAPHGAVGFERADEPAVAPPAGTGGLPLGRYASLLDEQPGQPLSFDAARERFAAGGFTRSTADVPNLGNRAPPRWMHLNIDNPGGAALPFRIYVAEGWTDQVDVWLLHPNGSYQHWLGGDERSPARFLRAGLGFGFDSMLPPGRSELYVRADSIDSAALALRLVPMADTGALEGGTQHWLGLVHGFLLALVASYGLLWIALRETNLLRYVVYVGSYLYMHLSYSGFGATEVWPQSPGVAQFAILVGMTLFSGSGLWFARGFLGLAECAPTVDRVVAWAVRAAFGAMAVCMVAGAKAVAVDLAFAFIMGFTFLMVGLGVLGIRCGRDQAPIFLAATLVSMAGALVTTLAVMGRLPFSALTFRAVEVGVMVEAAVWALALGLRLRRQQDDRTRALELARHDPLTGLLNRRGFLEQALAVHSTSARNGRPLAMVMLDIDHFKRINDAHGHAAGDRTLVAAAGQLQGACRRGDVVARWGGEEFVMLLPETAGDRAEALAERLRELVAETVVALDGGATVRFTASFGVAVRSGAMGLEDLLRVADEALYAAKAAGRDCVVASPAQVAAANEQPTLVATGR